MGELTASFICALWSSGSLRNSSLEGICCAGSLPAVREGIIFLSDTGEVSLYEMDQAGSQSWTLNKSVLRRLRHSDCRPDAVQGMRWGVLREAPRL